MKPLDRLRWKLTAWYVATFGAILIGFSVGLFFTISHSIAAKLDRSLLHAATELRDNVIAQGPAAATALRIPDRALYLLDAKGDQAAAGNPSGIVQAAAREAAARGDASLSADIGHEHTLLVHAIRFTRDTTTFVAVATADTEELEDEYAQLITVVSVALGLSLIAVGAGGYSLARRASRPVEASFEHMRRFMADAAHELRTPVAFLRARADLVLDHERSVDSYTHALREIGGEAARMGTIVDDLLTLARADAGDRRILHEALYLDDVVIDAVGKARPLGSSRDVSVDVSTLEEARIDGDPRLLGQLVCILLDNAIKYTPAGGAVTAAVETRGDGVSLTIQDTGIGIAQADLPNVFDRFYRSSSARARADGAGLGLAIAHWIVTAHDGRIDLTSEPGIGTRVTVTLPLGAGAKAGSTREKSPGAARHVTVV